MVRCERRVFTNKSSLTIRDIVSIIEDMYMINFFKDKSVDVNVSEADLNSIINELQGMSQFGGVAYSGNIVKLIYNTSTNQILIHSKKFLSDGVADIYDSQSNVFHGQFEASAVAFVSNTLTTGASISTTGLNNTAQIANEILDKSIKANEMLGVKPVCQHVWKVYTGLNETFKYCTNCDMKRENFKDKWIY